MLIKEVKPLDVNVSYKLKDYNHHSEIYTVEKTTPYGGRAINCIKTVAIPYDIFGIVSGYSIERTIKLAYTNQLIRLIPI